MAGTIRMVVGLGFLALTVWWFIQLAMGAYPVNVFQVMLAILWALLFAAVFYSGYRAYKAERMYTELRIGQAYRQGYY